MFIHGFAPYMFLFSCGAKPDRTKMSRSLRAGFVLYQTLRGAEASAANDIPHLVCFTVFSSRFRDYCSFLRKAPEENHIVIIPQAAGFLNRTFPLRKKPVISGNLRKRHFQIRRKVPHRPAATDRVAAWPIFTVSETQSNGIYTSSVLYLVYPSYR